MKDYIYINKLAWLRIFKGTYCIKIAIFVSQVWSHKEQKKSIKCEIILHESNIAGFPNLKVIQESFKMCNSDQKCSPENKVLHLKVASRRIHIAAWQEQGTKGRSKAKNGKETHVHALRALGKLLPDCD